MDIYKLLCDKKKKKNDIFIFLIKNYYEECIIPWT